LTENDSSFPSFNWAPHRGHKKILLVGGTGHGKSTFINSLHNYFGSKSLDEIEVVIPTKYLQPRTRGQQHTELGGSATQSQTQDCTEYRFTKPGARDTSITFIDTPGLADTRGLGQVYCTVYLFE